MALPSPEGHAVVLSCWLKACAPAGAGTPRPPPPTRDTTLKGTPRTPPHEMSRPRRCPPPAPGAPCIGHIAYIAVRRGAGGALRCPGSRAAW
jgi:hypothetical protein